LENKDLAHHLDAALNESVPVEKIIRQRLSDIKRKYQDITRVEEPLKYRILNLKTFGIAIIAGVIIVILARFLGFI